MHNWKIKAFGYLEGAWRYRWFGVALAWVICLAGWAGIATIPDRYQVAAKVYIDTDSLMGPLLKGLVVNQDSAQQIPVMLNRLITRPNIEQVIRLTKPEEAARYSPARLEEEITKIQSEVGIRPIGARNLYTISYTDQNNRHAVSVTQTLLSILVDSNIGDKRRDTQQAQTFIDKRIQEYAEVLRQAEQRRTQFRQANLDISMKGGGAARLDAANAGLSRANEEMSSALTRRDTLRAQVASTPATVAASAATTVFIGNNGTGDAPRGSPVQMLESYKVQLSQLLLRYTEAHPDVIAIKKTIERLEKEAAGSPSTPAEGGSSASPTVPNPVYVQLRARLTEEEVNVAVARHRVDEAQVELANARKMIGQALELERQQADLDRDYAVISDNYQTLVKSRETARMGQAVTDEQSQIAFDVIEPPVEAPYPVSPNRIALNSLVLFAGLGAGFALSLAMFLMADQIIVSSDLSTHFGLPVVGVVTRLRQGATRRAQMVSAFALSTSVGLLFAVFVGVLLIARDSVNNFMGG